MNNILRKIWNLIYLRADYELLVCHLATIEPAIIPENSFECRLMDRCDVEALRGNLSDDEVSILKERLVQGRKGYAAYIGGEIASFAWTVDCLARNQWFEPFVIDIHPRKGAVYIYDCFTSPAHRNKGAMSKIMQYIVYQSKASGYLDCFYLTKNPSMRNLGLNIGYTIQGNVNMCRILKKQKIKTNLKTDICMIV